VTTDGVYWHPVTATDERLLVRREIEPLRPALDQIYRQFCDQWAHALNAVAVFPCA
jgi:hypothetical protein